MIIPVHRDASTGRRLVVLGVLSLLGSSSLKAETSTEKWIQRYDGAAAGRDYPNAVAVDREGNVAVTGMSDDEQNRSNPLTLKYASDTGELLWGNRFNTGFGSGKVVRSTASEMSS